MNQVGAITFVTLSLFALSIVLVYGIVRSRRTEKEERERFGPIRALMDGGAAKARAGGLEGRFRGRKMGVEVRTGSRFGPPALILRLACSGALRFEIVDSHRTGIAPPPDALSPNRLQVGDADLDERFNFVSRDGERFRKWALASENRAKFEGVLAPSASGDSTPWPERRFLSLENGKLEWRATHYADVALAPEALRDILEILGQIAHSLESS
ncbi:MAG: hypothetical protein ACYDD2_02110 [Candidatus Acidiferrales bacterium]